MDRSRRGTTMLVAAAALVALGRGYAVTATGAPPATSPTTRMVAGDISQLAARMGDETARQDDRDEAARRLVARGSEGARAAIRAALEGGNRNAQLAAARGVAGDVKPDVALVPALFRLMGGDRVLTEAAGQALSMYRENGEVTEGLLKLATAEGEREGVRVAAIRALAGSTERRVAEGLVGLLKDGPAVAGAAGAALAEMPGDLNQSEEAFRLGVLKERAARLDRLAVRQRLLEDEVGSVLSDQYQVSPDVQKPDLLLRYLRSAAPAVRAVGARLVFDDAVNNRTIPPAALEQLREMVGDSSAEVRIAAADGLRAVNDVGAVTPLLTQLAQERDDGVRAAIARGLGASGDLRAVPALRGMLGDASVVVAQAAADAIREVGGKLREADGAVAKEVAGELKGVLDRSGDVPRLRESAVLAMGAVREPAMLPVYYRLLRSAGETGGVRRAAVKGIGELRQPRAADALVNLLGDGDATVRLEAVDALGRIGMFQHVGALYGRLDPKVESDPSVREHAWRVMEGLFKTAPVDQLGQWAERFAEEPARRLVVLMAMAGQEAGEPLAHTRKAIGETLLSLNRPGDAAGYLRQSLEYWETKDERGITAVSLSQELLTALLRAKQYPAAVAFGGQLVAADGSNQQTVGPAIRGEVRRLVDGKDVAGARALIGEARRMTPVLDARYLQALEEMDTETRGG